jgi:hypothetical protein
MEEPVLLAELRRRRLLALEQRAQPADEADAEERRAEEATAARLRAIGIRLPPPPPPPAAAPPPAADPQPPPPQQQQQQHTPAAARESDAYAEPICRICHGGAELGRLFTPCRCRGTTRFVHPACLAAWRTVSVGRDSFYVCDVCGFRYNVRRAGWAGVLESEALLLGATAVLLLAVVLSVGAAIRATGLRVDLWFYKAVLWLPPWYDAGAGRMWHWPGAPRAFDTLVTGGTVCGAAGTAAAALTAFQQDREWFYTRVLPSIAMAFASSGTPALRMMVLLGVFYGWQQLALRLRTAAKEVLTRFGERVLDVDADTLPPAAAVRDLTE